MKITLFSCFQHTCPGITTVIGKRCLLDLARGKQACSVPSLEVYIIRQCNKMSSCPRNNNTLVDVFQFVRKGIVYYIISMLYLKNKSEGIILTVILLIIFHCF